MAFLDQITAQLGNMRKPALWVVYPKGTSLDAIIIQSDTRIARLVEQNGKVLAMLSAPHASGSYNPDLSPSRGAKVVECPMSVWLAAKKAQEPGPINIKNPARSDRVVLQETGIRCEGHPTGAGEGCRKPAKWLYERGVYGRPDSVCSHACKVGLDKYRKSFDRVRPIKPNPFVRGTTMLPSGAIKVVPKTLPDAEIWLYPARNHIGEVAAAFFYRKSSKPLWQYRFPSVARRDAAIATEIARLKARETVKVDARAKVKASTANLELHVGDVFANSWGYGQTNVDFYVVVAVYAKMVGVQECGATVLPGGSGDSERVVPDTKHKFGPILKKRPYVWESGVYIPSQHGSTKLLAKGASCYRTGPYGGH